MTDVYEFDPLNPNVPALQESGRKEATTAYVRSMVWYLETMTERGRPYKDGRRPHVKIRRFSPGVPYASVRAVLDVLSDNNIVTDPLISGHVEPGKWRVSFSHYRKDSRYERVDAKDATATIVQDLVPYYEDGDGEEVDGGGDCRSQKFITYVWDAAVVDTPALPYPKGVSYSVQNVSRDDETGLFDYALVKEVAIEQYVGPYISQKNNRLTEQTEIWYNAYEIPEGLEEGAYTKADGVIVQVSIQQNPDCTYNITRQTTTFEEFGLEEECIKTLTEHQHTVTRGGEEERLGEAPEAADGVVTRHESREEEDGSFTNTVSTTTEKLSENHEVKTQTTLAGTRIEKTHRHMTDAQLAIINERPVNVGEAIEYRRTDGGLFDVTQVCFTVCGAMETACSNCETVYQEIQENAKVTKGRGREVASAENGVISNVSYDQTEYGTWRETTQVLTEKPVRDSRVTRSVTLDGEVINVVHRNQRKADADGESASEIGDSLTVEINDGGSVDITKQSIDRTKFKDRVLQESGTRTCYQTQYGQVCIALEPLECTKGVGKIKEARGGVIYSASSCLTDSGSYRNTESVTCETQVEGAEVTTLHRVGLTVTTVTCCHMDSKDGLLGNEDVGTASYKVTDGGLYDTTVTKYEFKPCSWEYVVCDSVFETVVKKEKLGEPEPWDAEAPGERVEIGLGEDTGAFKGSVEVRTPKFSWATRSKGQDFHSSFESGVDRNCTTSYYDEPVVVYKKGKATQYRSDRTEYEDRYNISWTVEKAADFWYDDSITIDTDEGTIRVYKFANSEQAMPPGAAAFIAGVPVGLRSRVSQSVSRDKFGLWSGEYQITSAFGDDSDAGSSIVGNDEVVKRVEAVCSYDIKGSTILEYWQADRVDGYDQSSDNAMQRINCHHEDCASSYNPSWQWDHRRTREGKQGRAQWAAFYTYYSKVALFRVLRKYQNEKGQWTYKELDVVKYLKNQNATNNKG